jgi:hypothetical protein
MLTRQHQRDTMGGVFLAGATGKTSSSHVYREDGEIALARIYSQMSSETVATTVAFVRVGTIQETWVC